MATFVVEDSSKSKRCQKGQHQGSKLVLGSSADCDVRIKDYVLAPEHCLIIEAEGGFAVEDLGTGAGTYVDGKPIPITCKDGKVVSARMPIRSGTTIVLGISKLTAEVDWAQRKLTLKRGDFHFDNVDDPRQWSESEVGLGRFRPLFWANVAGVVLIGAGACLLVPGALRDQVLEPGSLRHEAVAAELFQSAECETCHASSFERPASAGCLVVGCHEDLACGEMHPFGRWADHEAGCAEKAKPRQADTMPCRACHVEHRESIEPPVVSTQASCVECHRQGIPSSLPAPPMATTVSRQLDYRTFSHALHYRSGAKVQLECGDCHVKAEQGEEVLAHSEFRRVTFERCMECHEPRGRGPKSKPGPDLSAHWHGARDDGGSRCLQCHETLYTGAPRLVARVKPPPSTLFSFESRSHAQQADQDCGECHRRALELLGGRPQVKVKFEHRTHLTSLADPLADAQCLACHAAVARSPVLAGNARPFEAAACGEVCHADRVGVPVPQAVPSALAPRPRLQAEFPHDVHLEVERRCFGCHVLEDRGVPLPSPRTETDVQDCSRCHTSAHEAVAGGHCQACHVMGGEVEDVVYGNNTVPWERPVSEEFTHWSRGHLPLTQAGRCGECHDEATTRGATTIDAVPIPADGQTAACRGCHVGKQERFHWR
ncbi:MAG: FHA domain-containing protein [Planctomycetes bacterium]|nr:FHA domain-containing protein [Planctomycetota bacterium]